MEVKIDMYKPKIIKGLKIEYDGETYDKISYLACSNDGVTFEHNPNDSTYVNVHCKLNEIKVISGDDK